MQIRTGLRVSGIILAALGTLLLLTSALYAQTETGQVTGTILDQSGAAIPNARVTIKNNDTGATRTALSNAAGIYTFTNLMPGNYTITVDAQGFTTAQQKVTVTVGSRIGADIKMEVGKTGTTIEVSAAGVVVNTETQTLGETINTAQIVGLPTITRDPYALVGTVGNVSPTTPTGANGVGAGVGYSINGQRSAATNVMLDGTANNDEFGAMVGQRVPLDSVQEFSVLTNNFTAEYGRASAGVVNVVTKSGTNDYHGSAYEFGRYSALASNDFDHNANGIPKPVFTRNQFGYSIGGPVLPKLKDKLFFFNNTEWIRVRSQNTRTVYVPTPQFINYSDANTQAFFKSFGALQSNLVSLGTFSKADFLGRGLDLCKGLAASSACASIPSNVPLFQRVAYNYPADAGGGFPENTYMTVGRVDYNMTDTTQMYVRYALYHEADFAGAVSDSPYSGYDSPNSQVNNSVVYSLTHSFSPQFVSQSKVDFNRFNNQQPFGTAPASPTLYLGSATSGTRILGDLVALPGYDPYTPGNGIPFGGPQNYVQLYQDLSYMHGKHHFQFGGSFTYLRDNRTFGAYETAVEAVGNTLPKGIDDFVTGNLYQFQAAIYPQGKFPCGATPTPDCTVTLPVGPPNFSRSNRYKEWALYAQDSWKITPRLTFNYGLRWEVFGPQHNKNSALDANYYYGSGSNVFQQIANGAVFTAPNSPTGALWNTVYTNLGPVVGLAWDVFGDGKTSLRGGYGRHFERNFGNVTFNVIQNPPNYAVLSLISGQDLPTIAISSTNEGPLAGNNGSKALPKVSLRAVDPNIKTAYVDSYSAALEHRFGQNVVGAVEFSASRGENQYGIANINKAGTAAYYLGTPCTPGVSGDFGTCAGRLRATQYTNINFRTNGGFADYNAMNLRLDWRATGGLTLITNYTWSHAIDTLSDTFSSSGNQQNLGWLDPFNPNLDKGNAYYDLRHRVAVTALYNIPVKGTSAFARYVLGGWAVAPIFTAYTGSPYSLYDCTNAATVCPYAMFTQAVPSSPSGPLQATATPNHYVYFDFSKVVDSSWYNPRIGVSDFGPFPANMIGRNFFTTPGFWNLNFAIHKSIPLGTEKRKLTFRGEFFNIFNHPNLFTNVGESDVSSFDFVSASYSGNRNVQLGIRLDF